MFGLILCIYEIKTLLDRVSSVYGLPNQLDEIHAKPTLNQWTNQEMVPYFVEFTLVYFPHKSVKRQALAKFLVDYPSLEIKPENDVQLGIYEVERRPWVLKIDGSSTKKYVGARIVID